MIDRERDLGGGDRGHRPGDAGDPGCGRGTENLWLRRDQSGRPPIRNKRGLEALRADAEQPLAAVLPDQPARLRERLAIEHVQKHDIGLGASGTSEAGSSLALRQVDAVRQADGDGRLTDYVTLTV